MKKIIVCLCFVLMAIHAQAEVLTWVDKEGKKHYGDKVPAEYANQTKTLEVQPVNSMQAVKPVKTRTSPVNYNNQTNSTPPPATNNNSQNLDRCQAQIQAYKKSEACYANCKISDRHLHTRNVSNCNCEDAKKPDPDCRP